MKPIVSLVLFMFMVVTAGGEEKAAPEKEPNTIAIEQRANEAFNRGQYSQARQLFTKVLERVKDDQRRQGVIEEQIRVCDANIQKLAASLPASLKDPAPGAVEMSAERRKKHVAPREGATYVTSIKELGNFEYDPDKGGNIPEDVKALNGVKVQVHGFMIPLDQADQINHFSLVPSLFICCFGGQAQIQHQIVVHTPKGKAIGYFPDEIVCEGILRVEEKKDDGYIVSVFELDVQSVKPAAK